MLSNLKHLFYDIHSHSKVCSDKTWKLNNLTLPKDAINTLYTSQEPFSVGLHPWFLLETTYQADLELMEEIAQNQKVWAIGETGLDKVIQTDFLFQIAVFQKHIEISEKLQKPLIIHCVKAYNEIVSLHKKLRPTQNWLIHGFRANTQIAFQLQEKGIYLSFGEALLKSPQLQKTFAQIAPTYLLLETDDSLISIKEIYEKAAEIRRISIKELQKQIKQNLCKFFPENIAIF
jgi:TatD DNase family protein